MDFQILCVKNLTFSCFHFIFGHIHVFNQFESISIYGSAHNFSNKSNGAKHVSHPQRVLHSFK